MPAAIETRDLVKIYKPAYPRGAPGVKALDGLTFAVETGTIFGLLGPNGAGKSTTMKILTTLSRPDSGEARVAGIDVLANPDAVRRVIGYVAQKSGVDPESTGRENLTLQGQLHGMRGVLLATRVDELLDRFQLKEAGNRPARGYSAWSVDFFAVADDVFVAGVHGEYVDAGVDSERGTVQSGDVERGGGAVCVDGDGLGADRLAVGVPRVVRRVELGVGGAGVPELPEVGVGVRN